MPTTWQSFDPGDIILDTHVKDAYTAINNIESGASFYVTDTQTDGSDNYTGTLSPAISSYTAGLTIRFKPAATNNGVATINLNGIGSNIIKLTNGNDIHDGDMVSGGVYILTYNGSNFLLLNPSVSDSSAVITVLENLETPNNVQADFTVTYNILPSSESVIVNGIVQIKNIHYTISSKTISFSDPPETGDDIYIKYIVQ